MTALKIKGSPLLGRIMQTKKRILLLRGGSSSTKTYSICQAIAQWLLTGRFLKDEPVTSGVFSIIRKYSATLDKSVLRDFQKVLEDTGHLDTVIHNKTNKTYEFNHGGHKRIVEFFGADDERKLRGPRRDYLYCNEANEINYLIEFHQLNVRTRKRIVLDFNPDDIDSWLNVEIEQGRALGYKDDNGVFHEGDVDVIISTYKDNPFLSEQEVKEIENLKHVDEMLWVIYCKGEYGSVQGRVFKNVQIMRNGVPLKARLLAYGLDFGYTNDPTALIGVFQTGDELYCEEMIYARGLTNDDIADILDAQGFDKRDEIIADCAEPKSIEELTRRGYNVKPVSKGKDSINFGLDIMLQHNLWTIDNSPNIMKEFRKYCWIENKDGEYVNKPIDKYNHGIDAIRYVCMAKIKKRKPMENRVRRKPRTYEIYA